MPSVLHPKDGVRVLLQLVDEAGPSARYDAAILGPASRVDYRLRFTIEGALEIDPLEPQAHEAIDPRAFDLLRAVARTIGRHARAGAPAVWPRRVLRWRRVDRG